MEKELIYKTLQSFFEGFDTLNVDKMLQSFHPSASLFSINDGFLNENPVLNWKHSFSHAKNDPNHPFVKENSKKDIKYIDISGNVAACKVEYSFTDFKFFDYYNLVKIDGSWLIVNKTFVRISNE